MTPTTTLIGALTIALTAPLAALAQTAQTLAPAPGCDQGSIRKARSAFRQQYDRKDFATARATLEPVLKGCEKTLDWLEEGWIRNDVALAQLRTGDPAECRRTLEPLAAEAAHSDDKIREMYPPADATSFLPIVRATRTNLRLCASAAKAGK